MIPAFPLHWLREPVTKLWLISPHAKYTLAKHLARLYPSGCGVCSATMYLIALVDPSGNVRDLPPPHQRYPIWAIANAPKPKECPCAGFIDLENGGQPWRLRASKEHHPLCQYDQHSQATYSHAQQSAEVRYQEGLATQARPDEWDRIRQQYRGR